MQDILFFLPYLGTFVLLALYRDRSGPYVFKVSCASVLMLFYLLYNHVGLILLYNAQEGVKQLRVIDPNTVILLAWYSVAVVLAYVVSGVMLGRKFTAVRVPDVGRLRSARINWPILVIIVAALTPLAIWKALDQSPLLILLSGDAVGALAARVDEVTTDRHFLGIKPSYINILWSILSFAQIVVLVVAMTRKRISHWAFFIFVTLVVFLQGFANVSKGAIIGPLYIVFFTYSLLFARGAVLNKALFWTALYVVAVVAAFSAWAAGLEIVSMWYPFERLILGNLLPQYVVVDSFGFENLLYGATVPTWFSFGLHQQFLLDVFAWREIMGWVEGRAFYTAPSSFVAEAHANFHVFGVVAGSLFVFMALRSIDYLIKAIKSEVIYTALMVDSCLHYAKLAASGATSFFVDYHYWAIVLFALIGYRISLSRRLEHPAVPRIPLASAGLGRQ